MAKRLPKKVRQQAKRAEDLMNGVTEPQGAVPVDDPVDDVLGEGPPNPDPAPEPAPPGPVEEPAPEPIAATQPDDGPGGDPWETRYNTLKGKYDAEVPRLLGTVDGLQSRLQQLEDAAKDGLVPPTAPVEGFDDAEDRETYGGDFIDLVDRRVQRLVDAEVAKITPQIDKVHGEVTQVRQLTAQDKLYAGLTAAVPDWKTINSSPEFLNWLDIVDPYTGAQRMQLLQSAFSSAHGDRVIAMFEGYLRETAPPTSAPTPAPRTRGNGRAKLADLAAPAQTRTASSGVSEPAKPKPILRSDIRTFYSDVAKGAYKNRQEDIAIMERKIHQAVLHGLVT